MSAFTLIFKFLVISIVVFIFSACEKKSTTGAAQVHWDRDMCENCVMVVSDRRNAVQVIDPRTGKVHVFDDIGCMAVWFEEQRIDFKDEAIVWITDVKSGEWINARTAFYDTRNATPMNYGFSAHKSGDTIKKEEEIVNYGEVLKRSLKLYSNAVSK